MEKREPSTQLKQNSKNSFPNSHLLSLFSICIPAFDRSSELCLHGYILTTQPEKTQILLSVSLLLLQRLKLLLVGLLYVT